MSVKIDFLVPGFSKCGTTTLCQLLADHPEIFIPRLKEPWYFSAEDYEARTPGYIHLFSPAAPGQLRGEGSSSYSSHSTEDISIARIKQVSPDCKFIFIVRNPWQRIESAYREMHNSGIRYGLNPPFEMARCLEQFPQIILDSCYFQRISRYLDAFGEPALMVLFLEDLKINPQKELARCFRHLGVDEHFAVNTSTALNPGHSKLYDSPLLRQARSMPLLRSWLAKIDPQTQDRYFSKLGLRRVFGDTIPWDQAAIEHVAKTVVPDAEKFLQHYGKPANFWASCTPPRVLPIQT